MILVFVALGFTSIIGQIVLMRELVAVLYGNELIFGLVLACWMLWEAAGAWGLGFWARRRRWGRRKLGLTLMVAALALPLEMILVRSIRELLEVPPGALIPIERMLFAIGLILAPYCLAHGLGFSLGTRLLGGDSAGRAYTFESVGAVIGGAFFSLFLINRLDPFQAILVVTVATLIVTLRLATPIGRFQPVLAVVLVLAIVLTIALGDYLNRVTLARQWPRLVFFDDSRYGRLIITAQGDQRAFFENGLLAFETESTFPEEVVHLPLLAHLNPRRVLLIGGGVAGDVAEILKHAVDSVTYLELDPMVIRAALTHLPPEQAGALTEPRVQLIHQDGRSYTKHSKESFDVIIVDLPEPSTGQLNRFYTLEFFQEINILLATDGVFSIGLPSAENYWSPELARRNASVFRTLQQVFPTVLVAPGDHIFFLSTKGVSFPGADTLGDRFRQRKIATRWVTPEYISFLLTGDRFQAVTAKLQGDANARLNLDLEPICYFYDLALWISRFGSNLRSLFETTSVLHLGWLALPLVIGSIALWGRRRAIGVALVAGTGFSGMTLQIVLMLSFQALHGYIYHQVGLLVTAFMGGLALGAGLASWWRPSSNNRWLTTMQGGLMMAGLGFAMLVPRGVPVPQFTFPLFAMIAGTLTGVVFPLAALLSAPSDAHKADRGTSDSSLVAGLLYGADLLGGSIGAICTSILLVPVLGVVQTCLVVALVAGTGVIISLYPSFSG